MLHHVRPQHLPIAILNLYLQYHVPQIINENEAIYTCNVHSYFNATEVHRIEFCPLHLLSYIFILLCVRHTSLCALHFSVCVTLTPSLFPPTACDRSTWRGLS